MEYKINYDRLGKAIRKAEMAMARFQKELYGDDPEGLEVAKMACIQAFEFTFEQAKKHMARHLARVDGAGANQNRSMGRLVERAKELGLLKADMAAWREFYDMRNTTSHEYDEELADKAFHRIPAFIEEAKYLYDKLQNID